MKCQILICYLIAIAIHMGVLSLVLAPTPMRVEKTFVDVGLEPTPPAPPPPAAKSSPSQPQTPVGTKPLPSPVAPTPPQAPTKTKGPERLTVSEPTYAQRSTPVYPYEARRRHEEGIVALELFIDAQGNLEKAVVTKSSGYPILDAAATEAMRQSRFEPARVAGMGVPSKATATITFRLE